MKQRTYVHWLLHVRPLKVLPLINGDYKIPTFIKSAYLSSHYSYPAQDVVEVGHDHQEQEDAETDIFGIYHEVV